MSDARLWINLDTMSLEGPDRKRRHAQPHTDEAPDCPGCGEPVDVEFRLGRGLGGGMHHIVGWGCSNPDCDVDGRA